MVILPLILLSLQLTFQPPIQRADYNKSILIQGSAKIVNGNQMIPIRSASRPLKDKLIIAVFGHVKTRDGSPIIPLKSITSKIIETKTDAKGIFKFSLHPGFYTFFMVEDGKAYLNQFDGNGFFQRDTSDQIFQEDHTY